MSSPDCGLGSDDRRGQSYGGASVALCRLGAFVRDQARFAGDYARRGGSFPHLRMASFLLTYGIHLSLRHLLPRRGPFSSMCGA